MDFFLRAWIWMDQVPEAGVDLIAQPQRSNYRRPVTASKNREDPAAISSAHPTTLGGRNICILIGPHRRHQWMHVHHPRLVKRRYLLKPFAPRPVVPILQPNLSSFGSSIERTFILYLFHRQHIPISIRVDASRKQNCEVEFAKGSGLIDEIMSAPRDSGARL